MDTDNALSEHSLDRTGRREYWTTITNGCNVAEAVKKSIEYLKSRSAQAVSMRLFADEKDLNEASVLLNPTIDEMGSPPLRITQNNPIGSNRIAIQIHAVSGMNSTPLYFEDVCVGRRFEDADAKYYMLNVLSGDTEQSKYIQTKEVFEKIHQMLSSFGLSFSNTIRTWLYASDMCRPAPGSAPTMPTADHWQYNFSPLNRPAHRRRSCPRIHRCKVRQWITKVRLAVASGSYPPTITACLFQEQQALIKTATQSTLTILLHRST
ncbi:MAG: hypothetical protein ACYSOI_03070 [Planctomycetota bacterium]